MSKQVYGGRSAETHRRHIAAMVRQSNQPGRIAGRAAAHRAKAEAHMEWVALGKSEHLDLAIREYQAAYNEEV
jgi:hypothetical protein